MIRQLATANTVFVVQALGPDYIFLAPKPNTVAYAHNPSSGEAETRGSSEYCPTSLVESVNSGFREKPCKN